MLKKDEKGKIGLEHVLSGKLINEIDREFYVSK